MNTNIGIEEFSSIFGEKRVRTTLRKMADIEINHCLLDIKKAKKVLLPFEERFQMTSEVAWQKYINGQLGDDVDIMEWMGLYENCQAFERQFERIKNSRAYAELIHSTH